MQSPDTRNARTAILATLRGAAPAAPLPLPDLQPYLEGPHARGSEGPRIDPATLADAFEAAAIAWRAEVLRATLVDWPQVVRGALEQRGCRRVAIGAASSLQPGLEAALAGLQVRRFDQPLEQWKGDLFDSIDAGVTGADAGIADTGTLLLQPGAHEPRTLSLVPAVHVAVLMVSGLYASLPAALGALSPQDDMPSNLLLISGPSKTADIQQVLAYGAHGPKELVIVLVNDLQEDAPR